MNHPLQIWHPFTQEGVDPAPLRIARAEGVHLYTQEGQAVIDTISSWWVNLHGHGHPAMVAAVAGQAAQLDHVLLAGFSHGPAEELAARLRRVLAPEHTHIFFSDDGSTAVEVALKLALQYWQNLGRGEKTGIVALQHAYHGDTAGAMSVSDDSPFTAAFAPLRLPVHRVHSAYCYRCPVGLTRESCHIECAQSLERLLEEKQDQIAAVLVEPLLQGAGGMIVHPVEFLQRVRALCTRHEVLLIADEVLTGFGRCGKMFACELAGVVPDLACLSKGLTGGFLPMGATVCTEAVHAAFVSQERSHSFFHGHSYTGNPLACRAALATLDIFRDDDVLNANRAKAAYFNRAAEPLRTAISSSPLLPISASGSPGATSL